MLSKCIFVGADTAIGANDNTKFIEYIESFPPTTCPLILRPSGFGKSSISRTLLEYYDMSKAGDFEKHFAGTYIAGHKTALASSFRVLRVSFSIFAKRPDKALLAVTRNLVIAIKAFSVRYPDFALPEEALSLERQPSDILTDFAANYAQKNKGDKAAPLYVLADGYDRPGVQAAFMEGGPGVKRLDEWKKAVQAYELLFICLKKLAGGAQKGRIFLTGESAYLYGSLLSGFNIANDISQNDEAATVAGFTKEELERIVEKSIDFKKFTGITKEQVCDEVWKRYGGFIFSPSSKIQMCNSSNGLFLLTRIAETGEIPDMHILRMDREAMEQILSLCAPKDKEKLYAALMGRNWIRAMMPQILTSDPLRELSLNQAVTLLFNRGFLTYAQDPKAKPDKVKYKMPNEYARALFSLFAGEKKEEK